jgi:hypothetical protein
MPAVWRRCGIAGIALTIAGGLLRTDVALALVFRGDDAMTRASIASASGYYRRALLLDPGSVLATDRLAFAAFLQDDVGTMRTEMARLNDAIARHRADPELRKDRALLELRLRQPGEAERDLAFVGRQSADARSLAFAGFLEARQGDCMGARALWKSALNIEPDLAIARRRMERSC